MIHPVQSFKNMSTKQKVATVAGTVAGAALITTAVAYGKGKKICADKFISPLQEGQTPKVKIGEAISEGYKKIGRDIASIPGRIKNFFKKGGNEAPAGKSAEATVKPEATAKAEAPVKPEAPANA